MKILIIGNGGREHAIGLKIKNDNPDVKLFFNNGNGGTKEIGINIEFESINDIVNFAKSENINLTIVGNETLLVEGIVDEFQKNNLPIFGPDRNSAKLEGDKAFAKDFMNKYGIRTAKHKSFKISSEAIDYLKTQSHPIVIKATGLAAGKGVIISNSKEDSIRTIKEILDNGSFGKAGREIVVEEFLNGFEVSILSIFNQSKIYPLISAKDHKKIFDNDKGPNTGGMGAISPHPLYTKDIENDFIKNILEPTLKGLIKENLIFAGVIFFGLMVVNNECYLLEYNLRMGDPETQTILPLMESNFLDILVNSLQGKDLNMKWKNKSNCCVVLASEGYPNQYEIGKEIYGLNDSIIMAGVKKVSDKFYTNGGRVLNVVCDGDTLNESINNCYSMVDKIKFDGIYFRKDIGNI